MVTTIPSWRKGIWFSDIISFPTEIGTKDSSIILAGNNEVIENCKEIIGLFFLFIQI